MLVLAFECEWCGRKVRLYPPTEPERHSEGTMQVAVHQSNAVKKCVNSNAFLNAAQVVIRNPRLLSEAA